MKYLNLYVRKNRNFSEYDAEFKESNYIILGVPLDTTSTYRSGSRFAPVAIREASINLESYSIRLKRDVYDLKVFDVGDLNVYGNLEENLDYLKLVIDEIIAAGKIPIILGGEHTITYGSFRAFKNSAILSFDAHLDMRDEYLGRRLSHATFMRRISEIFGSEHIMEVGVRALTNEEVGFVKKHRINYLTSLEVLKHDTKKIIKRIHNFLSQFNEFYLTVDMDVLDPSYAPAVGNPVPEGLTPTILLDLLQSACRNKLVGSDIVEVSPHYDSGATAFQAANIIFNILAFTEDRFRSWKSKSI